MCHICNKSTKLRKAKRLSQTEFAKIFSLTRAAVGAYEEGRAEPKLDKIIEIAKYFGLMVDQLVSKKISVNEIFHFDEKITKIEEAIPFVPLSEKKIFLEAVSKREAYNYRRIILPGVQAEIAIEVENFAGLNNSIIFCNKNKILPNSGWYIAVGKRDYHIFFGNRDHDFIQVWQICCFFTKDIKGLSTLDARLSRIEGKINRLLAMNGQNS